MSGSQPCPERTEASSSQDHPSQQGTTSRLRVERVDGPEAAAERVLEEVRASVARQPRGLISFATGGTYQAFFPRLAAAIAAGDPAMDQLLCTHLDEYLGYGPETPGGMVHELTEACPPLGELLRQGSFLPVPGDGSDASLAAHRARIERAGGVQLQLLGIGRNGHLAFNEPGAPLQGHFRRVQLSETTRRDAEARFAKVAPESSGSPRDGVPREAVSAGLGDIQAAGRLILVALGAAKADAVRAMLSGPIDPACPASVVRRHPDALVLLDAAAAARVAD